MLKVYSIEHDGFIESCNLRAGKSQNLSYSSNDVCWCPTDTNILATAATNGVISIWDLSKFGRQKQLLTYTEHERTAHTVTFHPTEQAQAPILLSGSQDGTIKCFDLKSSNSVFTIYSNSEGVRDIKFSPLTTNVFASVSENGTVQMYDIRKYEKCLLQFTAHSGPIYCCDWHPIHNWLATGSRDKQIKIWNMENKAALEYTIPTIAVVGRVKWRPEKNYQIASCALVTDYSVHVWDIRRPYMPYASFNEHTNITTGIAWKGNNPQILLSTSKDSTIFKHAFKDASKPSSRANPQGTSFGPTGDLFFSMKCKAQPPQITPRGNKVTAMLARQKSITSNEQFHLAQSASFRLLLKPSTTGYELDLKSGKYKESDGFIGCAKEYILRAKSLVEVCEHNAAVSKKFGKHTAATLWNFVKLFYGSKEFINRKPPQRSSFSNQKNLNRRVIQSKPSTSLNKSESKIDLNESKELDSRRGSKDFDSISRIYYSRVSNQPVILENSEGPFEDYRSLRDGFLYVGPHDVTTALSFPGTNLHHDIQAARNHEDMRNDHDETMTPDVMSVLKVPIVPQVPIWEPHHIISECLHLQADIGDVQTPLCIYISLGQSRKELQIDEQVVVSFEFFCKSFLYLELLIFRSLGFTLTLIFFKDTSSGIKHLR